MSDEDNYILIEVKVDGRTFEVRHKLVENKTLFGALVAFMRSALLVERQIREALKK